MAGLSRYCGRFNLSSLALRRTEYLPKTLHCSSTVFLSIQSRWSSNSSPRRTATPEKLTYDETLAIRTAQARRSVILESNSSASEHLYEFCRKHGPINRVFSFRKKAKDTNMYTLVEYSDNPSVAKLLENTQHFSNNERILIETRFLCISEVKRGHDKITSHSDNTTVHVDNFGSCRLTNADLRDCKTVTEQITLLYDRMCMNELEIRLRYFLCSEIESLVRLVIPGSDVRLFGSSVSGLGRFDSDIDVVIGIGHSTSPEMNSESDDRAFTQRTLSAVGDLLDKFKPRVVKKVVRILEAHVPIIKFHHKSTTLECDLSLNNGYGLDMGRLIHHVTSLDSRVAPLIFTVRQWARDNSVTLPSPGSGFSNFMLTLLVMYYLQTKSLLPAFKNLCAGQSGSLVVLSSDITLPREIVDAQTHSGDTLTLDKLLVDFFTFYYNFDFSQVSLSLVEGHTLARSSEPILVRKEQNQEQENLGQEESTVVRLRPAAALYIENPLDRSLNVSKNVNSKHLEKFRKKCAIAASSLKAFPSREPPWWGDAWGLLTVLNLDSVETKNKVGLSVETNHHTKRIAKKKVRVRKENNPQSKTSKRSKIEYRNINQGNDLKLRDYAKKRTADLKLRKNSSVKLKGLQEPKLNINIRAFANARKDSQH